MVQSDYKTVRHVHIVVALIGFPRTEFLTCKHSSLARRTNLVLSVRF